jgi:hydrogenase expression/formation protein HypC
MCVGVPCQVISSDEISAIVDFTGVKREISMLVIDNPEDVRQGDWVLVHAGYAVVKLEPSEAKETLRMMLEMAQADE